MSRRHPIALVVLLCACGAAPQMRLRRVVLYQNGIATFERSGRPANGAATLELAPHEVDDVIATLTVLDPRRPEDAPASSVQLPARSEGNQTVRVALPGATRDVTLAYSAPTSAWRASYRIVLPDDRGAEEAFLQAWAVVDNTTAEDWRGVDLMLATDAPLSFAVDLRTPRRVDRPNVTGHRVPAVAFGPVRSEHSTRTLDRDADGILDVDDVCPDEGEDADAFQDDDGCPEPDNDHDRIVDVDDRCPSEPETYNGMEDADGCPDVGQVVIHDTRIRILEQIFFEEGSSRIPDAAAPILDAVAATLGGSPEIERVTVEGHADPAEDRPWLISAERADVVRSALVDRGVAPDRLVSRAHGQSQPMVSGSSDRNRRVRFRVDEPHPAATPTPAGRVDRRTLARSARTTPLPETLGAGTRFPVARSISIAAGRSAMVTILHRPVIGEDVLLFRDDPNVPASARHPFRAARFVNHSGVDLVPGPVSLFRGGELVGEGLLDRLREGENAFLPYAVDTGTHVSAVVEQEEVPARFVSLAEGRVTLERTQIRRTRYEVEAGHRVPGRIYVHHARVDGFEPHDLPPRTEQRPGTLLVPMPIEAGRDATLTLDERRPVRVELDLVRDLSTSLALYLEGSALGPGDRARLEALLDERTALARVVDEARQLDVQLREGASRTGELRRSVEALDERGGRSSAAIRRRMAERLDQAVRHAEAVAEQLAQLRARELEARARLREAARGLVIPAP